MPAATRPIRIRMYRVGFGDFFLMSVPVGASEYAHILVDCGVHAKPVAGAMDAALAQMHADTGGRLALVIMTHRHADHISGFASGRAVFATMTVEQVWMSWFENPADKQAQGVQKSLVATAARLTAALAAAGRADDQHAMMAENITGQFDVAAGTSSNDIALGVLRGFKTAAGAKTPVAYFSAGQTAKLPPVLVDAGLAADILGPPTDLALVAQMDNKPHQYLAADGGDDGAPLPPFAPAFATDGFKWQGKGPPVYAAADVVAHIKANQPDVLAAAAQSADNAMNNQSLVVLFTFHGKTLLFSGDAQWGNWANLLFGGAFGSPGHTTLTSGAAAMLAKLDFYKVGHHGSTNATPIDVVNMLNEGCTAMCSTAIGAYGHEDQHTEVPRVPLLAALDARTHGRLARSDQVAAGKVAADPDAGTLPAGIFTADAHGFIDYLV